MPGLALVQAEQLAEATTAVTAMRSLTVTSERGTHEMPFGRTQSRQKASHDLNKGSGVHCAPPAKQDFLGRSESR